MKKLPRSKKVLEYALVSISALKSFPVGWGGGAWPILMSAQGPFPLKGEMFFDLCGWLGWELWIGPRARQLKIKCFCLAAMFYGALCCLTIFPLCIVAGVWQIAAGFIMIVIEAPFCCMFLDFVASFAEMVERRPPWQKTLLYIM